MNDDIDTNLDRRKLLRKTATGAVGLGALGFAGAATANAQDDRQGDDGQTLISRRFAFRYPERLGQQQEPREAGDPTGDLLQKILLVTDRKDRYPDKLDIEEDEVADCISGWSADELREWEAIIVDWKNASRILGGRGVPARVQATQLVELNSVVANPRQDPVPLGTPFIIRSAQRCPGDLVGVTASQIPGVRIVTGPGESTGEGNRS